MIEYTAKNIMSWTRLGMRKAFGEIMSEVVKEHKEILVFAADVASSAGLSKLSQDYPEQFFNVGIAEQNMVGIAAGVALDGNNVFITSFAPFITLRTFEAVHTLLGYMNLNVKVVGLASGFSMGMQGNTHYCLEDIAIMRTIPGIKILSPADCIEAAKCIEYLANVKGPAYLRLTGIDGSPNIYKDNYIFNVQQNILLREGKDIIILGTGSIVNECIRSSRALKKDNVSCAVMDVHTIKPLDTESLDKICETYKLIITVEEHSVIGGLGGAVAEYLAEKGNHPPLLEIGIADRFPKADNYTNMLEQSGLTALHIKEKILNKLNSLSGI